ncbi:chalcone-flavanone isomerase-domain-containing protein [Gilbertella persicaria]|uniref:chalcone-flavanone isomerase-domain-containing protein n=1 Tax=Gilbertella persicaria TaxID=101096 RepID=UPI0022200530|nr:chalcone-flavanone isomerase-domain-containing protein [Gilbertella persicaria]KAI8082480.1 chalcone-flavanone isomerase-domain-containing protein [Gilbertella persicaria]
MFRRSLTLKLPRVQVVRPLARRLTTAVASRPQKVTWTTTAALTLTGLGIYGLNYAYAEAPAYAGSVEDPTTKLSFPIFLNTNNEWKRLIGLGVRTVTFLKMNVYVLGMYMKNDDIEALKAKKGWKNVDKEQFLEKSELAEELLNQPYDVSIRLVPVRATSTQHLRDGFLRLLMQRMKDQSLTEDEEREILRAMQEFKSNFVSMNVKKDSEFIFTKTQDGLRISYEGKDWGIVQNAWLAKNFIMGYLEPKHPSSEAALHDIAQGLEKLMKE